MRFIVLMKSARNSFHHLMKISINLLSFDQYKNYNILYFK